MPTESPEKTPRLAARFSGGEQSATYAWHTGDMHEEILLTRHRVAVSTPRDPAMHTPP